MGSSMAGDAQGKGAALVTWFSITALPCPGRVLVLSGWCWAPWAPREFSASCVPPALGDVFGDEAGQLGSSGTVSPQTM